MWRTDTGEGRGSDWVCLWGLRYGCV
jgi:hypothetical protein